MARYGRLLTDAQWEKIQPLLPKRPKRPRGGRPRADDRKVLEGILWILRSGARWQDLPEEFPHPSTCWRRLRDWEEQEVWLQIWRAFLSGLNERQRLDWSESFLDGSFAPAKKGLWSRKNQAGQGDEVDGGGRRRGCSFGRPPSLCIPGGSPARGDDARDHPCRPAASSGPSAAEAPARDRRQSLRQRSVAEALAAARHPADLPAQEEPRASGHARWPGAATVQAAVDHRAHHRVAGQLSPPCGPL